jgi:hypothetical protein
MEGSKNCLDWQLKGNEWETTVRKGMDPQQHDDGQRSENPFSVQAGKRLTESLD